MKKIIKLILIYLVVANSVAMLVYLAEYIYHKTTPSIKSYREFVIKAMSSDQSRFDNYKSTEDYKKLMNAGSVDSIRFYYTKYSHGE